jgi:uncharacterized protein YhaN
MPRVLASTSLVLVTILSGLVAGADAMSQIGFRPAEAREVLLTAVTNGSADYTAARTAMKRASPELRASIVKGVLEWARAAVETAEYAEQYRQVRENQKPSPPTAFADESKQAQAELRQKLDEMKKELATMTPEMRRTMEEMIRQMEAQQKEQANNPAFTAAVKALGTEEDASRQQEFKRQMAEWEKTYPADVHGLIARRLHAFLDVSADVDFNAPLVDRNKRREFADPRYEGKSAEWKLCYRAGKPAVDVARAFATSWLATASRGR